MTDKKIVLTAITSLVVLIAIGGTFTISHEKELNTETSSGIQNLIPQVYAAAPTKQIIPIVVDPDYGSTSTFNVDKVECQTKTKDGITTIDWCKATATMDKVQLGDFLTAGPPPNWGYFDTGNTSKSIRF